MNPRATSLTSLTTKSGLCRSIGKRSRWKLSWKRQESSLNGEYLPPPCFCYAVVYSLADLRHGVCKALHVNSVIGQLLAIELIEPAVKHMLLIVYGLWENDQVSVVGKRYNHTLTLT